MTYQVPVTPAIIQYLKDNVKDPTHMQRLFDRGADLLTQNGYVVGPNGVAFSPFGDYLIVDTDRDPSAAIAAWSPANKSTVEQEQVNLKTAASTAISDLGAQHTRLTSMRAQLDAATTLPVPQNLAALRELAKDVDELTVDMQGLLKILRKQGVFDDPVTGG